MPHRIATAVLAFALVAVGCGSDDPPASDATNPTSTTQPTGGAALPGERQEISPYEGSKLAVAGVAFDDTLKVRSGPGTEFGVVFELPPTARNATATGHNRSRKEAGFWSEITVDIVGLGDDSVGGERLKIFGEPGSRRESFTVRSVEATTLCRRGVVEGGLCV